MFNKEGIPFFTIIIPFLTILFISSFSISYYLKLSNENYLLDIKEFKTIYAKNQTNNEKDLVVLLKKKEVLHQEREKKFEKFIIILTIVLLIFMSLFSFMMSSIINDIVSKYKKQVQNKEEKLQVLNKNLAIKVQEGIEDGKRKDKAILQQSKLARMGAMISMIAHQWRQPLTELSGILMELETATRFKKVNEEHILKSVSKSDKMIEFMSNTIDDFRNFYKPDKKKEEFSILDSCEKAICLVSASLEHSNISLELNVKEDKKIIGYPREFSQVILNLITNARDELLSNYINNPIIKISIKNKNGFCLIEVLDNAGGIKQENFDLIFDPYFSTKTSSNGTGLGLYISKLIIEQNMGGELNVENNEDGAIFKILMKE